MDVLGDLLQKEERIQKLDRQLQEAKESEYVDLRDKIMSLEKENKKLK
jgi:cell division septal protein FtsQ